MLRDYEKEKQPGSLEEFMNGFNLNAQFIKNRIIYRITQKELEALFSRKNNFDDNGPTNSLIQNVLVLIKRKFGNILDEGEMKKFLCDILKITEERFSTYEEWFNSLITDLNP